MKRTPLQWAAWLLALSALCVGCAAERSAYIPKVGHSQSEFVRWHQ